MNPLPRTLAIGLVGIALIAQTWLWVGVSDAPVGYTIDRSGPSQWGAEFLWPVVAMAGPISAHGGPYEFGIDFQIGDGRAVRLTERTSPVTRLLGPSDPATIAALVAERDRWQETTTASGVNVLTRQIGRISVVIEGALSYEELFDVARSLRPGLNWML